MELFCYSLQANNAYQLRLNYFFLAILKSNVYDYPWYSEEFNNFIIYKCQHQYFNLKKKEKIASLFHLRANLILI